MDKLRALDGRHPYREAVPEGHVDYGARRRRGADVTFFNFGLAREMGILAGDQPDRMTAELRDAVLDAFAIVIINEYDRERGERFPKRLVLDRTYMATRYLQLQHPGRTGRTSGDGRSVWNGFVRHRGVTWDITSCGTGVTRLCPATAEQGRFFKTGNWESDYGCGTATPEEGLQAALMSETFHANGLPTERVLAVIEHPDGFAVNVRAGKNLLRPSHLFVHLKRGDLDALRGAVDYAIEREASHGELDVAGRGPRVRYARFVEGLADAFARTVARFETDYVFCWLDWDGDNVLLDGGIIDYGSVRQFGLFHREYKFDDGPRWSTTIPQQRGKARRIVQTFAQIRDALVEGRKRPLATFRDDPLVARFDRRFAEERDRAILRGVGIPDVHAEAIRVDHPEEVERFRRALRWFERVQSSRGPIRVGDGITRNAVFSARDLLRELPRHVLRTGESPSAEEVLGFAASTYATRADRTPTPHRERKARAFVRAWHTLVDRAATRARRSVPRMLELVAARSERINRFDRITGDAVMYGARRLLRARRSLGPAGVYRVIEQFVERQCLDPDRDGAVRPRRGSPSARRALDDLLELASELRHGL